MYPLVSVVVPYHNAAATLPIAIASLIAQTYDHWECIIVDDGSSDGHDKPPVPIQDDRVSIIRLGKNMGRGFARQIGLDHARGDYLAMLDADDWLYPDKLRQQVEILIDHPKLALISAGMAIVDSSHHLTGIRGYSPNLTSPLHIGRMTRLRRAPVSHAPSMIPMGVARTASYDPHLNSSEDTDFLIQVLMERYYGVQAQPLYVYTELASISKAKYTEAYRCHTRMFQKYNIRYPLIGRIEAAKAHLKGLIYSVAFTFGFGRWIIQRRSRLPTAQECAAYEEARRAVFAKAAELESVTWPPRTHRDQP